MALKLSVSLPTKKISCVFGKVMV